MKSLKMKLAGFILGAAALLVSGAALAQTFPQGNNTTVGTGTHRVFIARGIYTSATTAPAAGVDIMPQSTRPVNIVTRGSVIASATINLELRDGTVLYSSPTAVLTTPTTFTFAAPVFFEVVRVSATTPQTGSNSVSVTIIQ